MTNINGDQELCTKCVSAKRFNRWIREHGSPGICDLDTSHGGRRKVVPVPLFAEMVDGWFREKYQLGGEEAYVTEHSDNPSYRQRGESYPEIMTQALECDQGVIEAIAPHLPDASHRDIAQGAEPFYDDSQCYESIAEVEARDRADHEEWLYENRFRYQWEEFCDKVQYERRFFKIKELLDELFGEPKEYESGKTNPVYMLDPGKKIYRARRLHADFSQRHLESDPAGGLGAPPRDRARPGRMNVEFIPVFYGAFSEDAAIAEIRPGIGEEVAVGEFTSRRSLKVFDFTAFARASGGSWKESYSHTRYDFINQMEEQISKPILPYEKQREYIATQIVAEYLKEYFGCDAVIFRSSMVRSLSAENRNIVILPRTEPFAGPAPAVLSFEGYEVKEVRNVTYDLSRSPF